MNRRHFLSIATALGALVALPALGLQPRTLHLWDVNDSEYVVAHDEADALAIALAQVGPLDNDQEMGASRWPSNVPFTFQHDDGRLETKTADQWVASQGRGYFCSANF